MSKQDKKENLTKESFDQVVNNNNQLFNKAIAENYLEYQKQAIDSFQSAFRPYVENANNQLWNNQDLYRKLPEIYSKFANNYAENSVAVSRIINNIAFSNVELFKNVISNTKE